MSLMLSKKYGANPSVEHCKCCGEAMGVVLFGSEYKENGEIVEAPHAVCLGNLCPECLKTIESGGIFYIEVRKGTQANPYRTGRLVAVKAEAAKRVFGEIKSTINYLEDDAFEHLFGGLSCPIRN